MLRTLYYKLSSGKNSKLKYYLASYFRYKVEPAGLYRRRLRKLLAQAVLRPDYPLIKQRVDYYCSLGTPPALPPSTPRICDYKPDRQKVYFFDVQRYSRWFDPQLPMSVCPGDVTFVPEVPSVVKSRPLRPGNANGVLMKLDRVRHFIFVNDKKPWTSKLDKAIFMGKCAGKAERMRFMEMYFGGDICECGDVGRHCPEGHPEWTRPKRTIAEHLDYKFIMALEGNDVASNLKWVMSSNSLAVMPEPTCETWFMEGTLVPDVHYVRIKPDFSDLEERMRHYIEHPEEAQRIIDNAHRYVDQFRDPEREKIISLLVLAKYLGQDNL